jgi:hypothetical protein
MAMGAIKERADLEMTKIVENILDINTNDTKKRTLNIVIDVIPQNQRQGFAIKTIVKSKLEPTNPVETSLYLTGDENGEPIAVEMVRQVPGQQDIYNDEQVEPKVFRLVK